MSVLLWTVCAVPLAFGTPCGDGIVDPDEECDGTACCAPDCTIATAGTVCRPAVDLCDAEETCNGTIDTCPADDVVASGIVCRSGADLCDAPETCDGVSVSCPADGVAASGVVCRPAVDACDADDTCDGVSISCPADASQPDGTECDFPQCNDPSTCSSGVCVPGAPVANGSPCVTGSQCLGPDTCQDGACAEGPPLADGTACNDHSPCTAPDTCTAGVCQGPRLPGGCPPFGGDDTGFVPPNKAAAKCEDGVAKLAADLVNRILKCNIKDGDSALRVKPYDGQVCQDAASTRWDLHAAKFLCPPCVDGNAVRDLTITLTNATSGMVFCDSSSAALLDAPGAGFVPPNKLVAKCEDGAAKNVGKLTTAIGKCHVKAADLGLKERPFDEEACEDTAMTKYDYKSQGLPGCPACIDHGQLRDLTETLLDLNNGMAYCASPSGAFIQ